MAYTTSVVLFRIICRVQVGLELFVQTPIIDRHLEGVRLEAKCKFAPVQRHRTTCDRLVPLHHKSECDRTTMAFNMRGIKRLLGLACSVDQP